MENRNSDNAVRVRGWALDGIKDCRLPFDRRRFSSKLEGKGEVGEVVVDVGRSKVGCLYGLFDP